MNPTRWIASILTAAAFATLLVSSNAEALPLGPTASVGVVITPSLVQGETTLHSMVGPVAQVGFQMGDWWDSQFLFQFSNVSGNVDYEGLPLSGNARVQTILGGYQLTFDIGGRRGYAGFTPYLGGGLFVGAATVQVNSTSSDPAVETSLEQDALTVQNRSGPMLELHAVIGLRYHPVAAVGISAELADSTYGGFFGTLEPKLSADFTF